MSTTRHTEPQIVTTAPPSHVAELAAGVDSWAVLAFDAGSYTAAEHARLADAVLSGFVPIVGEIGGPDAKITWYAGEPATVLATLAK